MSLDEIANRILGGIKGDKTATKRISEALASKDPEQIRKAVSETASIELSPEELDMLVRELESNPSRIAAWPT
jgi:hypothetical protein